MLSARLPCQVTPHWEVKAQEEGILLKVWGRERGWGGGLPSDGLHTEAGGTVVCSVPLDVWGDDGLQKEKAKSVLDLLVGMLGPQLMEATCQLVRW